MDIFAHRGACAYAPENTLSAFERAHSLDADAIELDVQLTKDGYVVVCHDYSVNRTSNGQGWVKDYTLADIKQLDFGSWFHDDFRGEKIPTLDEVLDLTLRSALKINIEIKHGPVKYQGIEHKVIEAVKRRNLVDRVIISSFYHPCLLTVKQLCPAIKIGVLFECRLLNPLELCRQVQADYLHPSWDSIDLQWAKEATDRGIKINTYTINEHDQYNYAAQMGVSGIFTNFPDKWRENCEKSVFSSQKNSDCNSGSRGVPQREAPDWYTKA